MKKLGLLTLIVWGSINCYGQTLPNCLTADEAKLVNLALEERYSMIQQLFVCDSTIHELTIQNHDYRDAMVSFKRESVLNHQAFMECVEQKGLLIKTVEKTTQINRQQNRVATKRIIGTTIGGFTIGFGIGVIVMLVK